MIALDTNILVYAHREDAECHEAAVRKVAGLAEGKGLWVLPWPCLHEIFSIVSHPRVVNPLAE